jgi:PAS domain S-box-containing protein
MIKGYASQEIIGQHFSIFYPPEDVRDGKPERELGIAVAEGRYQEEGWRVRKDGSRFWANVLITALFDAHGQLQGFGKVTRDMTELKLAEEQRERLYERELQLLHEREARAQMEQVERMRDSFLTVLAHELRTPLTSLLGNAQVLLRRGQREGDLSERGRHNMKVIVNQASRLNDMISLQLDISRLHTGQLQIQPAPLDVGALAQQVVEEFQPATTSHVLTYTGPDVRLMVEGDELRLIQVLQNLVQNAIKYSPGGGEVQIVVEPGDTTVRVAVSDTGMGIPQSALPHLFQRFYRATNVDERQISGLGIGLYVVKELVTLHGGTVDVVSEEGHGSTFSFRLPLLEDRKAT